MKKIFNGKVYSVKRVDKDEFLENSEAINKFMMRIIASHEYENKNYDFDEAKQMLDDLNVDLFTKEYLDVKLYMLKNEIDDEDVCFALYSHDETRDDWHLEFIATHSDYSGCGYGQALFKVSAKDLSKTEFPEISSVVAKNNKASLRLHNDIGDIEGIKMYCDELDDDRYAFVFDIKNLNKENNEEEDCLF